jgi:hypothetical protein
MPSPISPFPHVPDPSVTYGDCSSVTFVFVMQSSGTGDGVTRVATTGETVGAFVGLRLGESVGELVGLRVGELVGELVGAAVVGF